MIYSMTAFARVSQQAEWGEAVWEIRSVNHRFLDVHLRLPEMCAELDPILREKIRKVLRRGRIECHLLRLVTEEVSVLTVNHQLADQLTQAALEIKDRYSDVSSIDVMRFLNWPGMIAAGVEVKGDVRQGILGLFDKALEEVLDARKREGGSLAESVLIRLNDIESKVIQVKGRLPEILQAQRDKLLARFQEAQLALDPERLEQEMVLFAQKIDVSEELDRLMTHIAEVKRILHEGGHIGRQLDFFMQEFNREANTLASKSVDVMATQVAVELKVLIEQIREQVQNIE